ncbi:hypothetical protein MRX96_020243 [Rhipicephalus microplus]
MDTGMTLEDLLNNVDSFSVAVYRTRSQLRKFVARDIAQQRGKLPPCTGRSSKLLLPKGGRGSRQHPQRGKVPFYPFPSLLNWGLLSPQTTLSQVLWTRLI